MTGDLKEAVEQVSKIDLSNRAARAEIRSHLAGLHRSQAWAYLKKYFEGEQQKYMSHVCTSSNPNELLRYSGHLKVISELLNWPLMMVTTIDNMDKAEEAREKGTHNART